MTADGKDVARVAEAFESGTSSSVAVHSTAGDHAGVGEAVSLPSAGGARGRGFDQGEADSLPRGLALDRP